MRLTEERKTQVIGLLLTAALICQLVEGCAGAQQRASYDKINWQLGHSNKALTLLSNQMGLVVLDETNRSKNFENYRRALAETYKQHQRMSAEEAQLLGQIKFYGRIEWLVDLLGLIFVMVVMWWYSSLISKISKRIK